MDKDALRRELREQFERTMDAAIAAVERAPDGRWIAASEWQVRDAFLTLMGGCYQRILQAKVDATPAADAPPPFSPSAPAQAPRQGQTPRRRRDRRGRGDARDRRYFWSPDQSGCPADTLAGIAAWPAASLSPGARELCCLMGMACPSASASRQLLRVGGLRVSAERLRRCVEREGADAASRRSSGEVKPSFTADDLPPGSSSRLYVGLDGLFVPTVTDAEKRKRRRSHASRRRAARTRRGLANRPLPRRRPGTDQRFKEVKVGHVYDQSRERRHAFATAGDADAAGGLLRTHAALLKFDRAEQTRSVTDAAPWILSQLRVRLPMLGGMTLDLPHLAQHLHAAADACLGERSDAARGPGRRRGSRRRRPAAPTRCWRASTRWAGRCGGRRRSERRWAGCGRTWRTTAR